MKSTKFKISKALLFFLFLPVILFSQQKTGNIVEYFGKEKVNKISEGKLIHVFKKGLSLKMRNFNFNSASFPKDPVFARFLLNDNLQVSKNDVFGIDYLGDELVWKEIKTGDKNSFNDDSLRSSYVYLTYRSNKEKTVIFEASGHSLALINGMPHEGDHYDFGWNLIPVKLKKGTNVFVLKVGRFPRIRARLLAPRIPVAFTPRDITVPDILVERTEDYQGAIRVLNTSDKWVKGYTISAELSGVRVKTKVPSIPPLSVRKVPFLIPALVNGKQDATIDLKLELNSKRGKNISNEILKLGVKSKYKHHKKTFLSAIDGSVQYYSVAPSKNKTAKEQALFLSVHGASVEAVNQANAYKQKDWGNLIAPTNRRPFGFAWEDWGRLDALEVLKDAKNIYQPNKSKIYLTGHSMGGHGSWYLGATYPDHFAAIAPCAGYPDLLLYRNSFIKRRLSMPQERLTKMGLTPEIVKRLKAPKEPTPVELMIARAGTPSRTLKLIRNYLQLGVYVLHGEVDNVVPTFIARDMRERLGKFHNDFTYYEYPDGTHWYGNHSVDWDPIFDFFKQRTIKQPNEVKKMEFFTGSPGVSATSNFVTIHQQKEAFEISSFDFSKDKKYKVKTNNVALLEIDFRKLNNEIESIQLDASEFKVVKNTNMYFKNTHEVWEITSSPLLTEKGPHRNGGFKDAFRNNMVFVYATRGTKKENDWYFNRAKFDAETFWYRANGTIEIVKDVDFKLENYADRNVIVYGNKDNNSAWRKLLDKSPIQVSRNQILFGDKKLLGKQWGLYFTVPRKDSDNASIGVVSATGIEGMKASAANHYLVNGTTFPDVLIFDNTVLTQGDAAVKCAGFFGNDWSIEKGDFEWK